MTKHDISLHLMTKHDTSRDAPLRQAQGMTGKGMTGEVPASPRARNQVRETAPAQRRARARARSARRRGERNGDGRKGGTMTKHDISGEPHDKT